MSGWDSGVDIYFIESNCLVGFIAGLDSGYVQYGVVFVMLLLICRQLRRGIEEKKSG